MVEVQAGMKTGSMRSARIAGSGHPIAGFPDKVKICLVCGQIILLRFRDGSC